MRILAQCIKLNLLLDRSFDVSEENYTNNVILAIKLVVVFLACLSVFVNFRK